MSITFASPASSFEHTVHFVASVKSSSGVRLPSIRSHETLMGGRPLSLPEHSIMHRYNCLYQVKQRILGSWGPGDPLRACELAVLTLASCVATAVKHMMLLSSALTAAME